MTYPKAPIHEAVFDIKVDNVENTDIEFYQTLVENDLSDFPETQKKVVVSGKLKVNAENVDVISETQKKNVMGVIFSNPESNIKVQYRKDGYTLNMLRPYSDWHEFSDLAFRYWESYKKKIRPTGIERIGLRYINKIMLPIDGLIFNDYLNNMPQIPETLEDAYKSFFFKLESKCKNSGNNAIIIRTFNSSKDGKLPFILDIDVYNRDNLDKSSLKREFDSLRDNKNDIFESLITDKSRELFQ